MRYKSSGKPLIVSGIQPTSPWLAKDVSLFQAALLFQRFIIRFGFGYGVYGAMEQERGLGDSGKKSRRWKRVNLDQPEAFNRTVLDFLATYSNV